jgi:hypothetical protein
MSSSTLEEFAVVVIVLFLVSFAGNSVKYTIPKFLAKVHRYACLLAPAAIGTEGFAWPAPFLVSVAVNFASSSPHTLRPALELFLVTWLGVFIVLALYSAARPYMDRWLSRE